MKIFADLPEAIANTSELSSRLEFTLENLGYEFPRYPAPAGETEISFLRAQVAKGAHERYQPVTDRARRQLERELTAYRETEAGRLFPDCVGSGPVLPGQSHPGAGPRLGRQ